MILVFLWFYGLCDAVMFLSHLECYSVRRRFEAPRENISPVVLGATMVHFAKGFACMNYVLYAFPINVINKLILLCKDLTYPCVPLN